MEKVLFDTDIGSDIDDAVCLAYLLAQPRCDLLGITTVTGKPLQRARLASALCRVAGRDVPILPGAADPFHVEQQQKEAPQARALERWPHDDDFAPAEAVHFLSSTIRQHPGEVTLLAVGPLTNVGLLFATDPEAARLLKSLVLMCGVFTRDGLEWNAKGDPHATAITYRAPVPTHRSVGLDVTMQVQLDADTVRSRFVAPLLRPVLDFAEVWFEHQKVITFHDPLAAVALFEPDVCTFTPGAVEIAMDGERAGATGWSPNAAGGRHQVATAVDAEAFFERYFSVF